MIAINTDKGGAVPVYQQISRQIEEYIRSKKLPADTALPTVKDIAGLAGVSLRTADMALRALIDEGICYRRPKKGTFVAGHMSEGLYRRKIVGVNCPFKPDSLNAHHVENAIYMGLIQNSGGYGFTPFFINDDLEANIKFYRDCRETLLEGVIMLSGSSGQEELNILGHYAPIPFILINYDNTGGALESLPENIHCIFNDDYLGAYQAAEHLIRAGHRDFAIITFDIDNDNYRNRVAGYLQAISDNGLQFRPELLINGGRAAEAPEPDLVKSGENILRGSRLGWIEYPYLRGQIGLGAELFSRAQKTGIDFSAALCVNDYLAFGTACSGADVAVTGYDNIMPELSREGGFPTVAIDFAEMGKRALKVLAGEIPAASRVTRVMPQLIPRNQQG